MSVYCDGCQGGNKFEFPFSMAFQPIINISTNTIFAHEALVRGVNGEGAHSILSQVDARSRYAFDQCSRTKAIKMVADLGIMETDALLSINFMPNAVYDPRSCIKQTLMAAERFKLPPERFIFEFTEEEKLDTAHLLNILSTYRDIRFKTAIDDFGAGFSNMGLILEFRPDIVKLDMALIRNIHTDPVRHAIVRHLTNLFNDLGITVICEGIEAEAELDVLRSFDVFLIQGFLLSKPIFEGLASAALVQEGAPIS